MSGKKEIRIQPTTKEVVDIGPGNLEGRGNMVKAMQGYVSIAAETLSNELQDMIDTVAEVLKPREGGPESCQAKFGVKLNSRGNVILAELGSEVSFEVTVTWKR